MAVTMWTIEYSVNEDGYKMRHFDVMLRENMELIAQGISSDYVLIGIATSFKEGRKMADAHALTLPEKILNL